MRTGRNYAHGKRRAGLTLLEVTLATSVLLLSLASAISSQLAALSLMRTSRENDSATAELSAAMEEVTGQSLDNVLANFPAAQPMASYTDRMLRDERIVATYPAGAVDPLTIVLTLTWTDWAGRPARMRAATLMAR
jgi:type II secretory pathway pseudopilin PulG